MDASIDERNETCDKHGDYVSKGISILGRRLHWSICPQCAEMERQQRENDAAMAEAKERQKRLESRLKSSGIPIRFRGKSFENYISETDQHDRALSIMMEFANNFHDHAGKGTAIVLSGKPGTGKSHLAIAAAQQVMGVTSVLYLSAIDAIRMVRDTWRKNSERTETEVLNDLASVGLLILDEVGVQHGTDAEQVTLFDIIDKRYRDQMPIILLTNQNKAGMKQFLGDRSYDRLREGGIWIVCDWESYRGKG